MATLSAPLNIGLNPWTAALTVSERAVLSGKQPLEPLDPERGRRRLAKWRSRPPFQRDEAFRERLALDGLSEDQFLALLSGAGLPSLNNEFPAWSRHAEGLLERNTASGNGGALLAVAAPAIEDAMARLQKKADPICGESTVSAIDSKGIAALLLPSLIARLNRIVTRTMVLELNVARIENRLRGETPEERFRDFNASLGNASVRASIWREYPVLARLILDCVEQWVESSSEFAGRLVADWPDLTAFLPELCGQRLTHVQAGAGDTHRRGRSVMILTFGSSLRLVYKPRSLGTELHYRELIAWLNGRGLGPELRHPRVLDRGDRGWVEFAAAGECRDEAAVTRFYERLGSSLALLYALHATDFHFENVIAAGEYPILVDLETLFHPPLPLGAWGAATRLAARAVAESVLSVGLLPHRFGMEPQSAGMDVSAFGGKEGQMSAPMWGLEQSGTDEMRYIRKAFAMRGGRNIPMLGGACVDPKLFERPFLAGFERTCRFLEANRRELLSDDGPLARFAGDETRLVARSTQSYSRVLTDSYHPNLLRDALDRDRVIDSLWHGVEGNPLLRALLPAEREDIVHGDIPLFSTRAGSREVFSGTGASLGEPLEQSGLAASRETIGRLSETDLQRQMWLIRGALACASSDCESGSGPSLGPLHQPRAESHLDSAIEIGERLLALSSESGGLRTWIAPCPDSRDAWRQGPLGADLYGGLSGIGLFFAYLAKQSGGGKWMEIASSALETGLCLAEGMAPVQARAPYRPVAPFSSETGLLYTALHLAALGGDRSQLARAEALARVAAEAVPQDCHYDIISGSAGLLCLLVAVYESEGSEWALRAAQRTGGFLLAAAQPQPQGLAWPPAAIAPAEGPLSGFSHGASGIAYALLRLFEVTGDARYRDAALSAADYERSLLMPNEENWKDLRANAAANAHRGCMAWCHGAPGIALARLHGQRLPGCSGLSRDAAIAVQATLRRGFGGVSGGSHCLCHGDMGNLEVLLQSGDREGALQAAAGVLRGARVHGWRTSGPGGVELPGLMMGLAGIGYQLLRVEDPESVPAVLMLAGPVCAAQSLFNPTFAPFMFEFGPPELLPEAEPDPRGNWSESSARTTPAAANPPQTSETTKRKTS